MKNHYYTRHYQGLMSEESSMEVEMVSSSDEEDYSDPTEKIAPFPKQQEPLKHSPSKQDPPMKGIARSDATTTIFAPRAAAPVIRPNTGSGQYQVQPNGSVGVRAVLASGSPNVRYVNQQAIKTVWTSAVKKPTGNQVQRGFIATTAGQQSQNMSTSYPTQTVIPVRITGIIISRHPMITSSGTGGAGLSMVIGANKSASYLVSPGAGVSKAVSFVPGTMYLNTGADGQTKIVCQPGTGIVNQKDGRVIGQSSLRPLNMLNQAGGKVMGNSALGARCIPVQATPRMAVIRGGPKQVVMTKSATQMIRPQAVSSKAAMSVPQPVLTISAANALTLPTGSAGANAAVSTPSAAQGTITVSAAVTSSGVGARSPAGACTGSASALKVIAGTYLPPGATSAAATNVLAGSTIIAGANLPPGAPVPAATNILAAGTITAGATVSAAKNVLAGSNITAGANLPAGATVTTGANVPSGVIVTAGAVPGQQPPAPETKPESPEKRDNVKNVFDVNTTKCDPDAKSIVENKDKSDSEASNSQNSYTTTTSDGVKSSSDATTIDDDPEEVDLPEKKSAIRKATILSGTKPKLKTSLLNGVIEGKSSNPVASEMASLVTKSPTGVERTRKRKDNHKPATVVEPPQKLLRTQELEGSFLKPIPGAEDMKATTTVIKWDGMGLGMLPGSVLRFTKNAEGMLEVHEPLLQDKMEFYDDSEERRIRPRDPQEIYCCVVCSCYGLLSEFNTEVFCSSGCAAAFNSTVQRISTKLVDEPLVTSVIIDESRKAARRKMAIAEGDDKSEVPPAKQKKLDDANVDVPNQESTRKIKQKVIAPPQSQDDKKQADEKKPMIKLKSMDLLNASQSATGRQLRARESLVKKPLSKFVAGQDLEGEVSDDDEKIQNENTDPFPWTEYLIKTESKPAWVKLFSNPNPTGPNPFKIGLKLEAIDPERQGLICAATVSDVQGHRLKIHFDGYSNAYDFWTNIDSPNIFECGFCERQNLTLQPPNGMKKNSFNWATYQAARKVRPCHLSWFHRNVCTSTNMFRPGMKLEAVDKKNTQLTCVATCVGVLENRILVHFDSWSDVYDYWVDTSSPYIHPVGWCKARNRELTPPNYYNPATFKWDTYLKETKSEAAPVAAFTLRPPLEWKRNTKLEAVDKRAPHLLRVATIKEVLPYQIKIAFDGFPDHFGYWVDDDCPDIHPTNWGLKTGHQVSAPPEHYQIQSAPCPTPGCIGDGNWKGLPADKHSSPDECPYSNEHLNAESPLQDRMTDRKMGAKKKPPALGHESESDSDDDPETKWKFMDAARERTTSKGRLAADGSMVQVSKRVPIVFPAVQTYKGMRPAVLKSAPTGQTLLVKTEEESGNVEKRRQGRRLERRGSDRSLGSEVSSQERRSERRGPDKNLKVPTRRSLPVKTAAGIQAGSPIKGRALDATSTNPDRSLARKSAKADSTVDHEFANRIRTKVTTGLSSSKTEDILTWNYEQCSPKIKDLPPKCQASLKRLKIDGERFLMLTNLLQNKLFSDLTAPESKSLHNTVTLLHTEAVTGLDRWKPVKSNSKYGNTSRT